MCQNKRNVFTQSQMQEKYDLFFFLYRWMIFEFLSVLFCWVKNSLEQNILTIDSLLSVLREYLSAVNIRFWITFTFFLYFFLLTVVFVCDSVEFVLDKRFLNEILPNSG